MAPTESGQRIVRTWHDGSCATGDHFIQLEDGSCWKLEKNPLLPQRTTQRSVDAQNGRIYER